MDDKIKAELDAVKAELETFKTLRLSIVDDANKKIQGCNDDINRLTGKIEVLTKLQGEPVVEEVKEEKGK